MLPVDLVYYLKGFFDLAEPKSLNKDQIHIIRDELNQTIMEIEVDEDECKYKKTILSIHGEKE